MAISKPLLPPKERYVEVEVNGERRYRNVETGDLLGEEPSVPTELELAQQDITDLQLNDIEQGQQMTDLELTILGGVTNV
ncbi:MAG: hypothetical protein ACLSE7_07080 [Lachnospirales bacterium]